MKDLVSQYLQVCVIVLVQVFLIQLFSQYFKIDFVQCLCILALIQIGILRNEYLNHTHHEDES